jgi:hypothetical protein
MQLICAGKLIFLQLPAITRLQLFFYGAIPFFALFHDAKKGFENRKAAAGKGFGAFFSVCPPASAACSKGQKYKYERANF